MSQQILPFFDSAEAATKHAIEASGKDPKEVGHALWPDKSPAAARTALLNALNENRAERLTADQHVFVANYCRRYDWLYYVAMQCSHSRPEHVTPAEVAARLQQQLFAKTDELRGLLTQIDALRPKPGVAA